LKRSTRRLNIPSGRLRPQRLEETRRLVLDVVEIDRQRGGPATHSLSEGRGGTGDSRHDGDQLHGEGVGNLARESGKAGVGRLGCADRGARHERVRRHGVRIKTGEECLAPVGSWV
jgi:hypothetical protein